MKFKDVKFANEFIKRGLEINAITEEQVEEVRECEIDVYDADSNSPMCLCSWFDSGVAGEIMEKLSEKDEDLQFLDLSTYTPTKTAPLPIVRKCHRCDMEHEEAYPTEACKRLLDAEIKLEKANSDIKYLCQLLRNTGTEESLYSFIEDKAERLTPPTEEPHA